MTAVVDVDILANNLKDRHSILAQFAGNEDENIVDKIKRLDTKETSKTTIAMNILRLLQQYQQLY